MTPRIGDDWKQLAVKFGPGWALASILIYFLLASVSRAQVDIKDILSSHVQDMKLDAQRTGLLLHAICINQAQTASALATCADAAR